MTRAAWPSFRRFKAFCGKALIEGPKLNSHSSKAIFYIPLGVTSGCLFRCHQLVRLKLTRILMVFSYPMKMEWKPPFPGSYLLWRGCPGPFSPEEQGHPFSGRKVERDLRRTHIHVDREIFSFLSNSEILTGITSQDSKCCLSCHNPLKFFFPPFPCDSVSVSHSFSAGLGTPPPPCKPRPGTRKEA